MRKSTKLLLAALFFCGVAAPATPVLATAEVPADAADPGVLTLGEAVSEEKLAALSGGQDLQIDEVNAQISSMRNNATSSGNTLSALNSTINTGLNSIGEAFSNASGIVTVIQNSGNQVLIQNDMILNLWVK